MANLLALLPDTAMLARLNRAVEAGAPHALYEFASAGCWEEVRRIAVRMPPRLLVVDPYASGSLDADEITAFHERFGEIPMLAYGRFDRDCARDPVMLMQAGVREIVFRDHDDTPGPMWRFLSNALANSLLGEVMAGLIGVLPADMIPTVHRLILESHSSLPPASAARLSFCHHNTLRKKLKAAGLPSVNKLIAWFRLFHAAWLIENHRRTVEGVALALEFSSVSALRTQLCRYAAVKPSELRVGGLKLLLNEFRSRHTAGAWDLYSSGGEAGQ